MVYGSTSDVSVACVLLSVCFRGHTIELLVIPEVKELIHRELAKAQLAHLVRSALPHTTRRLTAPLSERCA